MFFRRKDPRLKLSERIEELGLIDNHLFYAMELQAALNPKGLWAERKYLLFAANHYLNEIEKQALILASFRPKTA